MKKKLVDEIREEYPDLALLLDESTYVDDMSESKSSLEEIHEHTLPCPGEGGVILPPHRRITFSLQRNME